MLICVFLFFFSSRRRHTRCSRDWSSDVCSSDLVVDRGLDVLVVRVVVLAFDREDRDVVAVDERCGDVVLGREGVGGTENRSEERRVGKERRFWRLKSRFI